MTDELDPNLKQLLDGLKPVPPRNPQRAARGRAQFLAESAQPVSRSTFLSLIDQIPLFRKERFSMNTFLVLALVFAALFGGAAGTAYAAQDDLPTEALYPVKILTEDARLALTSSPQARLELFGALVQTRTQEMVQLAEAGVVPPEASLLRLQEHTRQALDLIAEQPEPEMLRAMEQMRSQLETQLQLINECAAQGDPLRTLAQTRLMFQLRLQLLENGLADPQAFRNAVQNGSDLEQPGGFGPGGQPVTTPGQGGYGPGGQPETTPGSGSGDGPGSPPEATPGDGSGYGPGNPPEATPAEGGGYGPGNPPETTPGSGSGYGPGSPEATPNPPGGGAGSNPTKAPDTDGGSGGGGGGGGGRP